MSLKAIEKILMKINMPIAKFGKEIAGILLLLMTTIVVLQVFFRYIVGEPLGWSDELSRYMMIYMTYLCLPIIYLQDRNIAMTFLLEKLQGKRIYHLFMFVIHILSLLTICVWIYFGWKFFLRGNVTADSLPIVMYYIYIAPPLLFAVTTLAAVQKIISELNLLIHYSDERLQTSKGV